MLLAGMVLAMGCGPGDATVLIEGTVRAAATGAPLDSAHVFLTWTVEDPSAPDGFHTYTDPDGQFGFDLVVVRCSNLTLIADPPGFQPARRERIPCNSLVKHVDFALEPE